MTRPSHSLLTGRHQADEEIEMNDEIELELGKVLLSPRIKTMVTDNPAFEYFVTYSVARHSLGDWGEVDIFVGGINTHNARHGGKVVSRYTFPKSAGTYGTLIVVTQAGREKTIVCAQEDLRR